MRRSTACFAALLALTLQGPGRLFPPYRLVAEASAAVSIAYSLEQLVAESPRVVLAEVVEQKSEWAFVAGSRRIVTHSRLRSLESVYGDADKDVWVRTLGGAVGRIGQQVTGEAAFTTGERAVVFLTHAVDGAWVVTGMGQGHYPVRIGRSPAGSATLAASPLLGELLRRKSSEPSAHARLVGRPVTEAIAAIRAVKGGSSGAPR
jgi:hypothetical protein